MKTAVTVLMVIFCAIVLTSCTDSANELNERIEYENQNDLQIIGKDEVQSPADRD